MVQGSWKIRGLQGHTATTTTAAIGAFSPSIFGESPLDTFGGLADYPWIHLKQQKLGTIRVELSMKDLMRPGILEDINIGHCLAAKLCRPFLGS